MGKVNIRSSRLEDEFIERGKAFLKLSGEERLLSLVRLNSYAMLMKNGRLKEPQRKGLVIEKKNND